MEEKEKLIEQIHVLQVKRQKTSAEIPFGDLQTYERLRRSKAGLAVSPVIDGACSVCRVGVPVHIVRAARPGTEIVTCPSCGRILYATSDVKFKEFDHNLDNINR
jgi:predicted  nucleic acid-binding Zn-ribbon protein